MDSDLRDNVRGGYDRVEGSIVRSYDEIKGVTMSMSRNFHMLGKITIGEKVEKLNCLILRCLSLTGTTSRPFQHLFLSRIRYIRRS